MKILIISPEFPYPPDSGAKIRHFHLIKRIAQKAEIFLVALIDSPEEERFIPQLRQYCSRVETVLLRRRSKLVHLPGVIRYLVSGEPLVNKFAFIDEMREKIRKLITAQHFDIIQIEHTFMAPYIKVIPEDYNGKIIIVIHNIGFIQHYRIFRMTNSPVAKIRPFFNWVMMKNWEAKFIEKFDKCIVVSFLNKQILNSINPKLDISVIPNGVDVADYKLLQFIPVNNKNILFIGKMDYETNINAALYFYKEIFPIVRKQFPDSKFFIIGRPAQKIRQLEKDKNVIVAGYVEDVRPYYEQCAISVVPLRAGEGTRLKILEAMALGCPVVSTSIGCEGLEVRHKENILVADTPEEFARSVIKLLTDTELRKQIIKNARECVEANYSWDKIAKDLIGLYEELSLENH